VRAFCTFAFCVRSLVCLCFSGEDHFYPPSLL
jgi:hypothetical protein